MKKIRLFFACMLLVLTAGCDQYIARNFGGDIEHKLPPGAQLISMTWKETSLWVLYYVPETKTCVFAESALGDVMNGKVMVPNCNPAALVKTL